MTHASFARAYALVFVFVFGLLAGCSHSGKLFPITDNESAPPSPESGPSSEYQSTDTGATGDVRLAIATDDQPDPSPAVAHPDSTAAIGDLPGPEGGQADGTEFTEKKNQPLLDEALEFCEISQIQWQKGELESALEALDSAYSLILKVDTTDNLELIRQKEDLRFMISRRILEIYASRNIVVNGHHHEIPVVINKHVRSEIDRFTRGSERRFFIESYQRSGRYRPLMVSALKEVGLPEELSWLPLIESGFKPRALSPARALGLWQFIPSTGYKFGLKRDSYIDERLDPYKSTAAAISYLKELHQLFGDWTTVLAAYNCGEGRVMRVIRQQNVNYLDNFWDLYEKLPWETARYVPRFLATLHIVNNLEQYGFDKIVLDSPMAFDEVEIIKQVHLQHVAHTLGLPLKTLSGLNPELRYKISPPEKYRLRLPKGQADTLMAGLDQIPVTRLPSRTYVYHRVRKGETLSIIARKYRTSVRKIMRANNLRSSHFIRAGKRLKIPQRGYQFKTASRIQKPKTARTYTHRVSSGDSLWNIAKRYNTTTQHIQQINQLATTDLHIGQVLKLPGHPSTIPSTRDYKIYEVKPGDSPFTIAKQHNMALSQFLRINQLSARSRIYPGQQLFIK